MVAEADKPKQPQVDQEALVQFGPEVLTDPVWIRAELAASLQRERNALSQGKGATNTALREQKWRKGLNETFEALTGEPLHQAVKRRRNPLEQLASDDILSLTEKTLDAAEKAMTEAEGFPEEKKRRWLNVIDRARNLQRRARSKPILFMVYVGRDQDSRDGLYHLAPIHSRMFEVWGAHHRPETPNTLIEVHPGAGKSTCLRFYVLSAISANPDLRALVICETDELAESWIAVLRRYIASPRYKALYPHVRILSKFGVERAMDNRTAFTLNRRRSWGAAQPTCAATGVESRVQGVRYDWLVFDDAVPAIVKDRPREGRKYCAIYDNVLSRRKDAPATAREFHICTHWGPADLASHIRRIVASAGLRGWLIAIDEFAVQEDAEGNPISLWPARFDTDWYKTQRAILPDYDLLFRMRNASSRDQIVSRIQRYTALRDDPAFAIMRKEDVARFVARLDTIEKAEQWLSIDPSATNSRRASETAVGHFALTADGQGFLRRAWFLRLSSVEMQVWLVEMIVGARLFEERYVKPDDDPETANAKRLKWRAPADAGGGYDYALIEAQGPIRGIVDLWKNFVERTIRDMGVTWNGCIVTCDTRIGNRSNQNMGKDDRLRAAAGPTMAGFVKFPGRWEYLGRDKPQPWRLVLVDDPDIQKLADQIIQFNTRDKDGVDMFTQFVNKHKERLCPEAAVPKSNPLPRWANDIQATLEKQIAALFDGEPDSPITEEDEWLSARLSA